MDLATLKQLVKKNHWDEIVEDFPYYRDPDLYSYLLKQNECPVDIILDLWLSKHSKIRILVAKHPNTPVSVLRKMIETDADEEVRKIASLSYYKRKKNER